MSKERILEVDEMSAALRAHTISSASDEKKKNTGDKKKDNKDVTSKGSNEKKDGGYDRWSVKDDSKIDYGHLHKTGGKGISDNKEGYYITTAINYTNGAAHIGHAYEATTSDVVARFQRSKDSNQCTYFVTGSDEHGQKIATTAEKEGKQPKDICDKYVNGFQCLNQRLLISNDDYIRTTSDRHKRVAKELWKKCYDAGDIYLDTYKGWYNVREETFVTDLEAEAADFKDTTSGLPLKRVEETSYFFKMSKYKEKLIDHIENVNSNFIRPEKHKNQILSRLKNDDLRDLSISRTTFKWGISAPDGFEKDHVMYVWVDALSNYLTGVNALGVNNDQSAKGLEKFWPASVHIIGKDILWFHTVIWPCLLFSANISLPETVFAHGFVNDKEGKKMSKSLGNVVDPHDMLDKYDVDTFRWYTCKEAPYGGELSFNEDNVRDMHNADLCDTLGNLVHRATSLCQKFCDSGIIPDVPVPTTIEKLPFDIKSVISSFVTKMDNFELQGGANIAIQGFRDINKYLDEEAPWLKKGDEHKQARQISVRTTLEAIYALSHLLLPFLPNGGKKIFEKLNTPPVQLSEIKTCLTNIKPGTKINVGEVLYQKLLSEEEIKNAKEASGKKKESYAEAQKRKKEQKAKQNAASAKGQAKADQPEFTKLDIRVGKIVKVWNHEDSEKLFCEQIDLGESTGPREIASGLREHYTLEEMQDKRVLVICNLKPAKLGGFKSNGMVLAASLDGKVKLVTVPEDAPIGERVYVEGLKGEPISAAQVKKRKVVENVAKKLKTNDNGVASYDGKPILTSKGHCEPLPLKNAAIY